VVSIGSRRALCVHGFRSACIRRPARASRTTGTHGEPIISLYAPAVVKTWTKGIITDIFVGSRYRRKGLGAKPIEAICDYCRANDIDAVELQVTASNRRARSFYRALEFQKADRIPMGLGLKPHSRLVRLRAIARA